MTTHILNFGYTAGQTLTAQLFELGSDTVAATASSVTEATNRQGRYASAFEDVDAGDYLLVYFLDDAAAGSEYFTVAGTDGESVQPWSEQGPKAQAAAVLSAAAVSPIHADVKSVDEAAGVAKEDSVLAVLGAVEAAKDYPEVSDVRDGVEYANGLYVGVLDVGTGLPTPEYPPGSAGL